MKRARKLAKSASRPSTGRKWGSGDVYVALADPTRRRIIDLLSTGDQPVHTIADSFTVSRPAISQHLRVLREAGLVVEQRAGRERRYRLRAAALQGVARWIARYEHFWNDKMARLGDALDEMDGKP